MEFKDILWIYKIKGKTRYILYRGNPEEPECILVVAENMVDAIAQAKEGKRAPDWRRDEGVNGWGKSIYKTVNEREQSINGKLIYERKEIQHGNDSGAQNSEGDNQALAEEGEVCIPERHTHAWEQ